jgi:Clp amino terminal domain, pathogenicity island component
VTSTVRFTDTAGLLPHLAREEAERRHQYYLGPEHLLLGLLVEEDNPAVRELRAHGVPVEVGDDNLAARVLRAHGLTWATVRAGIDRLVAQGVLPGPQPSDAELLATLGIDLDAVMARLDESFGREAYYHAAQNVRLRPAQSFPRAPGAGTPLICWRVFVLVRKEAAARGEDITPAHWLLALLRDAEDPVEVTAHRYPVERRKRSMFGLPDHGPSPVRLLVESHELTLDQLRAAVLEELDRSEG